MAEISGQVVAKETELEERRRIERDEHGRRLMAAVERLGTALDELRALIEADAGGYAWACSIPYRRRADEGGEIAGAEPAVNEGVLRVEPVDPREARGRIGAFLRKIAFAKTQLATSIMRLPSIAAVDERAFEAAQRVNVLKKALKDLTSHPVHGENATRAMRNAKSHNDDQTHLSVRQATRKIVLLKKIPQRATFTWQRRGFSHRPIDMGDAEVKYKGLKTQIDELPGETKLAERFEVAPSVWMNYTVDGGKTFRKVVGSGPVLYLAPLSLGPEARATGPVAAKPLEPLDLASVHEDLGLRKDVQWKQLAKGKPLYYCISADVD